ncbi:MAG: PKD domain-containing protein [Saprospiraceae bacterium]
MSKHSLPSLAFLFLLPSVISFGQTLAVQTGSQPNPLKQAPIAFIQNNNQWDDPARFRANFEGNHLLFLETTCFTYLLSHAGNVEKLHHANHLEHSGESGSVLKMHSYKVHFTGACPTQPVGMELLGKRHNFFIGNDPTKWAGKVPSFAKIAYNSLYPGVDMVAYSQEGHFKYDFIVSPHHSPFKIKLLYEGADSLKIRDGNLVVSTSVEEITEYQPVAWQMAGGRKVPVPCQYLLRGNIVSFLFPEGYDPNLQLVIDPTVVASTVAGTANLTQYGTFGHSATFDNAGNIYTGGRCYGAGYPATVGAFDVDFNGGEVDITISKYNPTGTDLIYATYIGGNGSDFPHSLIADFNQRLYFYGSSNSTNFPTTNSAFQPSNGGGYDAIITVLSTDGSALVGSTYIGGTKDDGVNGSKLNWNYDDTFRGEIILDAQNNIFVATSTQSSNFPVTPGAFDTTFNGVNGGAENPAQDAVVLKASSDVSALYWCTYLGGDHSDIGNGLRLTDTGEVYVTGTAGHSNFPVTPGTVQDTWPGGQENAYIAKLSPDGKSLLASTFWGTSGDEHSYFIDVDEDNQVHIFGQSTGAIPVTPGTYSSGNGSRVFLTAFDAGLQQVVYSTVIGNTDANDHYDLVPVAFMVDKCNQIYFSGYYANYGLPTTAGAFNLSGDNFYLGVLEPNATALTFGTYFGNADHVDGGTSRFDKSGVVYQGVCSCQWTGELDTNPDAWASVQVSGCDVGVFKIDFEIETVTAAATASPGTSGCAPFQVDFLYTGQDASSFLWDFGDGSPISTLENPTHVYNLAGAYNVMLVATNNSACNAVDTFYLHIDVLDGQSTLTQIPYCNGNQIVLDASTPNASYAWQDGTSGATFVTNTAGIYWVDIMIGGCSQRDSFEVVSPSGLVLDLGPDTVLCDISSLSLDVTDGAAVSYAWNNGSTSPNITLAAEGTYWVEVTDSIGCTVVDSLHLEFSSTPTINLGADSTLCHGQTLVLDATTSGASYNWQDGSADPLFIPAISGTYWVEIVVDGCAAADTVAVEFLPPILLDDGVTSIACHGDCNGGITLTPSGGTGNTFSFIWDDGAAQDIRDSLCAGSYLVTVTDAAGCTVAETIQVPEPTPLAFGFEKLDLPCYGESSGAIQIIQQTGGVPPYQFALDNGPFSTISLFDQLDGGDYLAWLQDANGCLDSTSIHIVEPMGFEVSAGADQLVRLGQAVTLHGQVIPGFGQTFSWAPTDYLDCADCTDPTLLPLETTLYTLTATDPATGCTRSDSVLIRVEKLRNVFVPNGYSPNADGINDAFTIFTGPDVDRVLELRVFDRWGELVFENYNFPPNNLLYGWDGRFMEKELEPAVFVYYAKVRFIDGFETSLKGDVTLVK